jgi:hypothetical protein
MQHRPRYRTARWLAAACVAVLLAGCGEYPLDSVGERSQSWIGPIGDGVVLYSNGSPAPGTVLANDPPPVTGTAVSDPVEASVSVPGAGR